MNDDDDPDDDKTGPYCPPKKHRWKKGGPSPNPSGRPPLKKKYELTRMIEGFDEKLMNFGAKPAYTTSGEKITLIEVLINKVVELAIEKKNPNLKALQYLIDMYRDISEKIDKAHLDTLENMVGYKNNMSQRMKEAKARGKPLRDLYPHPDDILIGRDGSISVVGPQSEEEYNAMKAALSIRDQIEAVLPGTDWNDPEFTKLGRYWQRLWNQFDRDLPPRLRKRWPGPSFSRKNPGKT